MAESSPQFDRQQCIENYLSYDPQKIDAVKMANDSCINSFKFFTEQYHEHQIQFHDVDDIIQELHCELRGGLLKSKKTSDINKFPSTLSRDEIDIKQLGIKAQSMKYQVCLNKMAMKKMAFGPWVKFGMQPEATLNWVDYRSNYYNDHEMNGLFFSFKKDE